MAVTMIAIWMAFLWLLVKIRVLKGWALWMKRSPLAIYLGVMAVLFIPMNFGAPVGGATGQATIFTEAFGSSHLFRKIMLRMDTWLNFVKP